jgi:hypothetical protein
MRGTARLFFVGVLLLGCTARGPSREGAVPITARLALRPAADGEPWVRDIADAIGLEQELHSELRADGTPAERGVPSIEVSQNVISSEYFPAVHAMRIHSARRESLADALTRARDQATTLAGDIVPVYEHATDGWDLLFVHDAGGFELEPGAVAKLEPGRDGEDAGVAVFLGEGDGVRFEQLTREQLGRRVAVLDGDESLMIPTVKDVIPGGTLWITAGADEPPDALFARLVR